MNEFGISILLYHQVGLEPPEGCNLDCFCSTEQFITQMHYLKNKSYNVIPLSEARSLIFSKTQQKKHSVILSFDDGDVGFYNTVLPILQDMNFPAVLFAVSGKIGQQTDWIKMPKARVPIMTKNQLRAAHAANIEIGSHSVSHRKLTYLCHDDVLKEAYESKIHLEDIIGAKVTSFSYPHGDFNEKVTNVILNTGYENCVTCSPGIIDESSNFLKLPRNYITYYDTIDLFSNKLELLES